MKNTKMVLWIALIVTAVIPVYAQQYDSEKDFQIDWDPVVKEGVVITKYIGTKKEVSIPPRIQNNPVTGIGTAAFYEKRNNITRVIIPNSVTYLSGFEGCTSLTSITIPNSVTSIGERAFSGCTSLASVTIPNSVTSIGERAFDSCSKLTNVTIPNSVNDLSGFSHCTGLKSVTITNGVRYIHRAAFFDCTSLTSVTIPNSVEEIREGAFGDCTSLTSVTFEGNRTFNNIRNTVGDYRSFNGDLVYKYLANDGGPGTYTRFVGGDVWKKTQSISQPAASQQTTSAASSQTTAQQPAAGTTGLKYNYLSDDKKELGVSAGTARGAVVIPAMYNNLPITRINEYGFRFIDSITDITIPNSVTSIGMGAFAQCKGLTSITIPSSITSIEHQAFRGCDNLTSVTFQGTITEKNFGSAFNFPYDLRKKYLEGGSGTYTRTNNKSKTWTKQ
jgi:hypothetical protein